MAVVCVSEACQICFPSVQLKAQSEPMLDQALSNLGSLDQNNIQTLQIQQLVDGFRDAVSETTTECRNTVESTNILSCCTQGERTTSDITCSKYEYTAGVK